MLSHQLNLKNLNLISQNPNLNRDLIPNLRLTQKCSKLTRVFLKLSRMLTFLQLLLWELNRLSLILMILIVSKKFNRILKWCKSSNSSRKIRCSNSRIISSRIMISWVISSLKLPNKTKVGTLTSRISKIPHSSNREIQCLVKSQWWVNRIKCNNKWKLSNKTWCLTSSSKWCRWINSQTRWTRTW